MSFNLIWLFWGMRYCVVLITWAPVDALERSQSLLQRVFMSLDCICVFNVQTSTMFLCIILPQYLSSSNILYILIIILLIVTSPSLNWNVISMRTGNFFSFLINLFFCWRIIDLQNFAVFCQTSTWISHRYTYIPSLLKLSPISLPIPPL